MYKMDIKSPLFPLKQKFSTELGAVCDLLQLSRRWGCAGSTGGLKQPVQPFQGRCWALPVPQPEKQGCCSLLCPARLQLPLPVPAGVHPAYPLCRCDSSSERDFEVVFVPVEFKCLYL